MEVGRRWLSEGMVELSTTAEVCSSSALSVEAFLRLWNTRSKGVFHMGTRLFVDEVGEEQEV